MSLVAITSRAALDAALRERRALGTVGFVPTMGSLHEGHATLLRECAAQHPTTVLSIFVNPTQFGPGEDFAKYPRDLPRDLAMAEASGAQIAWCPSVEEMYARDFSTSITVGAGLTSVLCGAYRPGHFDGVATVVAKLLLQVAPDIAYFGQKDAQQVLVIRHMVRDLDIATRITSVPTVREPDGLAMSSRNVYLSPDERADAVLLSRALNAGREAIAMGVTSVAEVMRIMRETLARGPHIVPQYVEARALPDLAPIDSARGHVLLAIAAHVGKTRLIDNLALDADTPGAPLVAV